jgi:uracil-DNA glycosylase
MSDTYEHVVGPGWSEHLNTEFQSAYMNKLRDKIDICYTFSTVFPEQKNIFRAYRKTDFDKVKVLILGQDPYHDGAATGLAFDVGNNPKINPSLRNIKQEVYNSVGSEISGGNLEPWADQGVFLLNTILTVDKGSPKSHDGYGWEKFIAATLSALSFRKAELPLVVMLWGKASQVYEKFFTMPHQLVLKAPHPAAEAYAGGKAGYFGCDHFKKANDWLSKHDATTIDW